MIAASLASLPRPVAKPPLRFEPAAPKRLTKELERALSRKRHDLDVAHRHELRLRDEFLSHVSHELRTPLQVVLRFVSMLCDGLAGPLTPAQMQLAEPAIRNCHLLNRLIGDLLEAARIIEGKIALETMSIDLVPLLEQTVLERQPDAVARGIFLTSRTAKELPRLWADPARVRQILGNLVDNALKFTPEGGFVSLSAEPFNESMVRFTVADSGIGIPPDRLERIFDRLHQEPHDGENRGLGLGLRIARRLIEFQGGRLEVESAVGIGSQFHGFLPVYSPVRFLRPLVGENGELPAELDLLRIEALINHGASPRALNHHERGPISGGLRGVLFDRSALLLPTPSKPGVFWIISAERLDEPGALIGELRRRLTAALAPVRVDLLLEICTLRQFCDPQTLLPDQLLELGRNIDQITQRDRDQRFQP